MAKRNDGGRFISSGNPAGRPKGARNKITVEVRKAMYQAFERAGGTEYLLKVAQKDPKVFCRMLERLIPSELKVDAGASLRPKIVVISGIEHAPGENVNRGKAELGAGHSVENLADPGVLPPARLTVEL
jgi:hypothetical protein